MKVLRIAAVAALTAYGGIFASAGNAASAAGLLTGAPAVRTLATPAPKGSVEEAYFIENIIGTVAIIGTAAIIGIDTIIGTPITTVGTDGTVGTGGTGGTGIIFGFHIIGSKLGRRNLKKYRERKAAGPAFLSIIQCRHGFRTKRRVDHGAH